MSLLTWTVSDCGGHYADFGRGRYKREDIWSGAEVCCALAPQPRSIYSGPKHHGRCHARSRQGRLRAARGPGDAIPKLVRGTRLMPLRNANYTRVFGT
jgi:hypothetical protein